MKRKTIIFILLSLIVAFAPVTNWQVDENYVRGVVWRATMLVTFGLGYWWNFRAKKVNKNLTTSLG